MSITAPAREHEAEHHDEHEIPYETHVKANRLGLWLFVFSEVFLFGALLAARFVLWGNTRPELSQEMGLITTSVLLLSSFFMYRGETAAQYGDRSKFLNSTLIAGLLGFIFLLGVIFFEWNIFGLSGELFGIELFGHLTLEDGVYGGVFFAMTGMHAIHVVTGLFLIAVIYFNGRRGKFTPERHWGVEGTAIYWHFIDVVWIIFYPALYLIGSPV